MNAIVSHTREASAGRLGRGHGRRALLLGAVAAAVRPASAEAEEAPAAPGRPAAPATPGWPTQPIRLIVPFAPGGSTDLVARLISAGLQERLGQPVVIENRAGAGATVGSQFVAQSPPDGYTLVMSNIASHAISPALYRNVQYDPVRDFAHIALVMSNPSVFVCNKDFEARNLQDVIRLSKARREGLDVASSGNGSSNHLLIMQFARATGARLNHVPYRGAGPAMTDVIAGVVPLMSDSLPSSVAHIRQGSVRALGIADTVRNPSFPEVPTFREQGVDLVSLSWFGLSAPAGTPAAIVERLNRETREVLARPEVRARIAELGSTPGDLTAEGYTRMVREEYERWAPEVRASGAKVE